MPSAIAVRNGLAGAWRMMNGRADGLSLLDLSADGFWDSFYAIAVALPALFVNWLALANDVAPGSDAETLSLIVRLALIDLAIWTVPLVALALAAPHIGVAKRFVAYVVASNWASVIIVWLMTPLTLVQLWLALPDDTAAFLNIAVFIVASVLTWRMTNAAIGAGAAVATAVFAGIMALSIGLQIVLDWALAIDVSL